eukprot:TRINITY_DN29994_c0_g1_i1.p1 TRINITY_DN29994_c0_g1~~TRINITY_DN29994_c0_g1_i1.p1  ORF type:complete len:267 (+),score=26.33 TRINITY_DN29994_c0_g1_i1:64-801(+)
MATDGYPKSALANTAGGSRRHHRRGCDTSQQQRFDSAAAAAVVFTAVDQDLPLSFWLLPFCDVATTTRLSFVSKAARDVMEEDHVWRALYDRYCAAVVERSMLVLQDRAFDPETSPTKQEFITWWQQRQSSPVREGVVRLKGTARDTYDQNETPLEVRMGLGPSHRPKLGAFVQTGQGTKHNSPSEGVWLGSYEACPASKAWLLHWEEHLANSRTRWVYEGRISCDGRRASYHDHSWRIRLSNSD